MTLLKAALIAALLAAPAAARADDKADVEAFMRDYLTLWNAHDAATITARVYRLEGNNPWSTKDGLQAEFDTLKSQGFDHTDTHSITACILPGDRADVDLRYSRLKADGTAMPPTDRASLYRVRKFADGWRVIGFAALPKEGTVCEDKTAR
jgi:hypothetical protein